MNRNNENGATVSMPNVQNKMIDGKVHIFFRNNPARLEQDLIRFAESNEERFENHTFLNSLDGLKKLKWVCLNNADQSSRLYELALKTFQENERHSSFLDIHFEKQNQRGNYLLVGSFKEESVYHLGRYVKTFKIEDGVWYYSYYPIPYKFKRILYLKRFVETLDHYCPGGRGNINFSRSYPSISRYT